MQKGFVSFKHMKIKNKLSLLIALIVATTFAFALIVLQYAFSVYDEQLYQKSSQVLHLSSSAIEKELERIEQLSFSVATDTQIQSLLRSIADSDSDYDRLTLRQRLVDRLLNYVGSEPSLYSIHVMDAHGAQQDLGQRHPDRPGQTGFHLEAGRGGQRRSPVDLSRRFRPCPHPVAGYPLLLRNAV
ncbi:hypothetical protein VQ056_26945 [Paenibacillus sp. JTLBN-2024]